jgi:hypothetical protein
MRSEERRTRSIEIPNFSADHKWEIGDKIVCLCGKAAKENIQLERLHGDSDIIRFKLDKDFVVEEQPYVYFCEVRHLSPAGKVSGVKLVRSIQKLPFGNMGMLDYADEIFDIYSPNLFKWYNGNLYETYIVRSFNAPFTPLMGIACKWEWQEDYNASVIEYKVDKTMPEGIQ